MAAKLTLFVALALFSLTAAFPVPPVTLRQFTPGPVVVEPTPAVAPGNAGGGGGGVAPQATPNVPSGPGSGATGGGIPATPPAPVVEPPVATPQGPITVTLPTPAPPTGPEVSAPPAPPSGPNEVTPAPQAPVVTPAPQNQPEMQVSPVPEPASGSRQLPLNVGSNAGPSPAPDASPATGEAPRETPGESPTTSPESNNPPNSPSGLGGTGESPEPSPGVCFPASATVELEGGKIVRMDELKLGDRVLVGGNMYSDVYMFSHRKQDIKSAFVKLSMASGHELELTGSHYLYLNDRLAAAYTAKVGDYVRVADGLVSSISSVKSTVNVGLYNPQTVHGDIVVNGVKASTYTITVERNVAHAMLAPMRVLYNSIGVALSFLDDGSKLHEVLPAGAPVIA